MAAQACSTSGAQNLQTVVTNLQNVVLSINALTAAIGSQFGVNKVYTVATLPTVTAPARAFVTDSTVAAASNFGNVVAGSGTHTVPVYYDNASWKIG